MHSFLLLASVLGLIRQSLCQSIQTIAVGANGLAFTPDTLYAPIGSQVVFEFYPRNHSVASGAFDNPCQPDGRIFSGYMVVGSGVGPDAFVITINDTSPIWYYCSQNIYTHCQAGMVGVINPSSAGAGGPNLAAYKQAAARTTGGTSGDLPNPVGGIVEPLSAVPSANTMGVSSTSSAVAVVGGSSSTVGRLSSTAFDGVVIATRTVTDSACPAGTMKSRRNHAKGI